MTLDGFRDVTETPISLDFSNSWIADIRLNAGDKDGRTITVAITDNGQASRAWRSPTTPRRASRSATACP